MFRKKKLIPVFLKVFQKVEEEESLSNSFSEAIITLTPKPYKHTTRKESYRQLSPYEHWRKNPQQNTSKMNSVT